MSDLPVFVKTKGMCDNKILRVTRSKAIYITVQQGQGSYQFNVNTFQKKIVQKIEVQDPTGQGLVLAPAGQTLASTAIICQSYITLVSLANSTDHILDPYPTSRFLPSNGTARGAGLSNYTPVEISGAIPLDMNNSTIFWPDATILTTGQVVQIQTWYRDMTAEELTLFGL